MFYIIADNQELTAAGIKSVVNEHNPEGIIVTNNYLQLIERLRDVTEAIVFLDYTLFDFNDVEMFIILTERFSNLQWIMISDDLTDDLIRKIIYQTRNVSFVFKDAPLSELHSALSSALSKLRFISQRITEVLLGAQMQSTQPKYDLTPTEKAIILEIAHGLTTKEIASKRFLSIHTVNTHRKNIFSKLNVNTAHDAIKYAVRAGIVNPSEFYI
ncbi:MAG: response regulator transcription factor [Bacteroidales bacterium]|nr:response regulator transcription factor [Bacteroidales bacterium]